MITDIVDLHSANVYGIYGHLGGGKSMTAVEIALEFLARGFPVVSNIALRGVDDFPGNFHWVQDFTVCDFWSLPCGAPRGSPSPYRSAIIIDEAAEMLNQFSSTSAFTVQFLSWLRQSSKRGQFVFLIVQRPEFLVKAARLLVNVWILCDDMRQWRMPVFRVPVPFLGGFVRRLAFDRLGNQISRGMCLCAKDKISRYYNTAQIFNPLGNTYNIYTWVPPPMDYTTVLVFLLLALFAFRLLWLFGVI